MNEIIKQYGRTLLAVVIVASIFTILITMPIPINGKTDSFLNHLKDATTNVSSQTDDAISSTNYQKIKTRKLPTVTGNNNLKPNTAYTLNQLITAKDADNKKITNPIILEIYTKDGNTDITSNIYNSQTKKYTFPSNGIYKLKVYIADSQGTKTTCFVQINLMDR